LVAGANARRTSETRVLSLSVAWLLLVQNSAGAWRAQTEAVTLPQAPGSASVPAPELGAAPSLEKALELSSLEIAALAEKFDFEPQAIKAKAEALKRESKKREDTFKAASKAAEKQIELKEKELSGLKSTLSDPQVTEQRKRTQCEILKIRKDITDRSYEFLQEQIGSDVRLAKLQLLGQWRQVNRELEQKIASEAIARRRYGNVLDIGARSTKKPFVGQEKDVQWGQREIEQARERKVFPKEIDDPVVTEYVKRIANNIARDSDLQVPLKVFVVQQQVRKDGKPVLDKDGRPQQITNAMALPGGFLIVFSGVLLESENESEFGGVIAHEMAHVAARHSNRLANKGRLFSITQLATFIGLQIFAPGLFSAASYLGYYLKGLLLQAIFDGMGIVFTINALGVSRDFELEADQLGMQYAWKAGYDPEGFINLFDHLSRKEGYASHTSFFATHPAFVDRTLSALKEYKVLRSLAPTRQHLTDTSEFQEIKERLRSSLQKVAPPTQADSAKPSLKSDELDPKECDQILGTPSVLAPHQAPVPGSVSPELPAAQGESQPKQIDAPCQAPKE